MHLLSRSLLYEENDVSANIETCTCSSKGLEVMLSASWVPLNVYTAVELLGWWQPASRHGVESVVDSETG
jgi:hypothetical protein